MMKFFINDEGRLWNFDSDGVGGKIVIPQGVKTIGWKAFTHPSLFRAVIPDSVEVIEEQAFLNCEYLHEIIIPDSVKSIGFEAFSNCSCLSCVSIPESVTDINPYAFHTIHNFGEYRQMSGDFYIYGKRGSAAERFANESGFPFRENEADKDSLLIGGDVYEFPMKAGEFFENGWEIIDIYQEDVDENYLLEPGYEYELCLDKNHDAGAMTWIYNDSDKALPVSECTVIYFCINWNEEALLPGGALLKAKYKSLDEGLAAFNKDMTEFDAEDMLYGYEFAADGWDNCSVRINFGEDPRGFTISTVKYYALDPELIEQN